MAHGLNNVFRHLRQLLAGAAADESDGQLLERFATRHEEEAFAALMQRHAPMVLNVCRRLLVRDQDVEDAFQATFLVLARRAASLERRASVGGWLHAVAFQTSLKARFLSARRHSREQPLMTEPTQHSDPAAGWDDLRPVLDEELNKLPDKYRAPIVLCYLEGKSNEEAARQLCWPTGTVKGRLARARNLLRDRLGRRGVALSAAALATLLETHAASAAVPAGLVDTTLRSALLFAAGAEVSAGSVSTLTEGVLKNMFVTKMKVAAVLAVLVVGVVGLAAWGYHHLALSGVATTATVVPDEEKPKITPDPLATRDMGKSGLVVQVKPMVTRLAADDPLQVALHFTTPEGPITPKEFPGNFLRFRTLESLTFKFTTPKGVVELQGTGISALKIAVAEMPLYYQPTFFLTLTRDGLRIADVVEVRGGTTTWAGGKKAPLDLAGVATLEISGALVRDKMEPITFTTAPVKLELAARHVKPLAEEIAMARADIKKHFNIEIKEAPEVRENKAGNRLFCFRHVHLPPLASNIYSVEMTPAGVIKGREVRERFDCVARGTLVEGEHGPLPIEKLRVGDRLWGYDPARGEKTLVTVRFVRTAHSDKTLLFAGSLRVTAHHPVFVNEEWRRAGSIEPTDRLLGHDLKQHPAGAPIVLHEPIDIYNVSVDGPHTFFAGGFLVHNKDRTYSAGLDDPWYLLWPELLPASK
ncbi:MAG: sigma-70 family RNA polymerase sigma factor [Gemmataceae bacterium]